jgi:hypothetical protein
MVEINPCRTCASKGYVGKTGSVIICPDCEGMGETRKMGHALCKNCNGHGKKYFVAQFFEHRQPCDSCVGTGTISIVDEDDEDAEECAACEGRGYESGSTTYSCKVWRKSVDFKKDNGASEIEECPNCEGVEGNDCAICDGLGKVVEFHDACSNCDGSGLIVTYTQYEDFCEKCEGTGWLGRIKFQRVKEVDSKGMQSPLESTSGRHPIEFNGIARPLLVRQPRLGSVWTSFPGMRFCGIEAGNFIRKRFGNSPDIPHVKREIEITVESGFWLAVTPCTQEQWETVMGRNPSSHQEIDHPVENVSWDEAMNFCARLTSLHHEAGLLPEDWCFHLPTNVQWEYACRAGTATDLNHGKDLTVPNDNGDSEGLACSSLDEVAWYFDNSNWSTHPVGLKLPNSWGLYDMHGNVWEWCSDLWNDPEMKSGGCLWPEGIDERVINGGSSFSDAGPEDFDVSGMHSCEKDGCGSVGFRVAIIRIPKIDHPNTESANNH